MRQEFDHTLCTALFLVPMSCNTYLPALASIHPGVRTCHFPLRALALGKVGRCHDTVVPPQSNAAAKVDSACPVPLWLTQDVRLQCELEASVRYRCEELRTAPPPCLVWAFTYTVQDEQ